MEFENIKNLSLKDLFIKEIESKIISGELAQGSKLPPERELAKKMGISKTVVNSGITDMAKKGFLEIKPRQGTYVGNYKKFGNIDVILSIMDYNYGLLSEQDIKSFLEMRFLLEKLAFSTLIPNINDEQLKTLDEMFTKLSQAQTDSEAIDTNYEIHHEICYMSGNTISPLIFSSFKVPILNMWRSYCETIGREKMIDNATKLHSFIKAGDAPGSINFFEKTLIEAFNKL